MFPDGVETITMTKENYDRNVEQLLYDKIDAQQRCEYLESILKEIANYVDKMSYASVVDNPKKDLIKILRKEK